ncbi:MAG: FAD-dependent oxidoreductase [Desulfocapsa sp.]|nr:FAD-dependent oxidoreductase [Desulfocapsa sp.]
MSDIEKNISCDVAIIGTGPSGLAAAITLKKKGIDRVIVLEREAVAGGIPRHCGHPPFGIREFNRIFTGPAYAKKIIAAAIDAGVEIWLNATVVKLVRGGLISIVTPDGFCELKAKRVLIATGTRETPRSARFVSGSRPMGVYNTGALQSLVYLNKKIPFRNPVIVGTEIVSFSALFTCWKAGIKPVAMLEKNKKASVMWPVSIVSKVVGVPLLLSHSIRNITGEERVRSVVVEDKKGNQKEITCDGVLFTGNFTPESSLMRLSHLEINSATGEPVTDGLGRCSDHSYFVAGNVQFTPVKVAGKCWKSGCEIAEEMSKHL